MNDREGVLLKMSGFSLSGDPRSLPEQLMTGVDHEIAERLLDELNPGWRGNPDTVGTIRPTRSLYTAIARSAQPILSEFERVPGAADALQRLAVSIWQYAFRGGIGLPDIAVRDTRSERDETEIHYTLVQAGSSHAFVRPVTGVPLPEFIEKRSAQMADVFDSVVGMRDAASATIAALRVFALRYGLPINQVGMKSGKFRPTADGGMLRFSCYWSAPASGHQGGEISPPLMR